VALAGEKPHRVRPGPRLCGRGESAKAPAQGGRCMTSEATLGPRAGRGGLRPVAWAAADKGAAADRGTPTILERVLDRLTPQCSGRHPSTPNGDPGPLRLHPIAGGPPTTCRGLPEPLRRTSWRAWIGPATHAPGVAWIAKRAGRLPVSCRADMVARPGTRARATDRQPLAWRCALRRVAPSGGRAVAGRAAGRSAPRAGGGGPAQDRGLDRPATASPIAELAHGAGRSLLQTSIRPRMRPRPGRIASHHKSA